MKQISYLGPTKFTRHSTKLFSRATWDPGLLHSYFMRLEVSFMCSHESMKGINNNNNNNNNNDNNRRWTQHQRFGRIYHLFLQSRKHCYVTSNQRVLYCQTYPETCVANTIHNALFFHTELTSPWRNSSLWNIICVWVTTFGRLHGLPWGIILSA